MKTVLLDFYASWCSPCKMQAPILDSLMREYPDIQLFKVDIDSQDGQVLITKHAIKSVPTLILFKDNKEVKRLSGLVSEYELRSFLNGR